MTAYCGLTGEDFAVACIPGVEEGESVEGDGGRPSRRHGEGKGCAPWALTERPGPERLIVILTHISSRCPTMLLHQIFPQKTTKRLFRLIICTLSICRTHLAFPEADSHLTVCRVRHSLSCPPLYLNPLKSM